jgi:myo-inositol-1-phosphate synthase
MTRIRVALVGVGNCASALVQGIEYYRTRLDTDYVGLMHASIGGYRPSDIEIVTAFDVDHRKVGMPLEEAVFAAPNCAQVFAPDLPRTGVEVQMGPILDGVAGHMANYPEAEAIRVSERPPVDVADVLRAANTEVLVCYLPVGSEAAVRHYAEACLDAGVAFVNCVPVFIASGHGTHIQAEEGAEEGPRERIDDSSAENWPERFRAAGLPLIGDDIKSQVGATIVHRTIGRLLADRGVTLDRTYQLNTGGNTDFLNMLERDRLQSKKISKTESVQSQLGERLESRDIHIGPSDYVSWQDDNKIAFIRLEGRGFGGVPLELELRLSVQDSPNSAGVVIDAIRCARLGLDRGLAGPLEIPSAVFMKSPPVQMRDDEARASLEKFIEEKPMAKASNEMGDGSGS